MKAFRNIKYNHFVQPGETLVLKIQIVSRAEGETKVKAEGWLGEVQALSARLVLSHHSIGRDYPSMTWKDEEVIKKQKEIYELIAPEN